MNVEMIPLETLGFKAGFRVIVRNLHHLGCVQNRYDLAIVKDDPYGELRCEGRDIAPLFRLAPERIIYPSIFSRKLVPGICLAWVWHLSPSSPGWHRRR
jgi:hypothetical protein